MTTLYRFFDAAGRLLYVGISSQPFARLMQHREDKPWWHAIASTTLEHFDDRATALAAELRAIKTEDPAYNIAGRNGEPLSALVLEQELVDELRRPRKIGLGVLAVRWPVAERLAEQHWQVVRDQEGGWGVALVVDGWYPDKRSAQESLPVWADWLEDGALVLPEDWTPSHA